MKISKLTKFYKQHNVKKLNRKQTNKVSGQGGIGTTAGVMGIIITDNIPTVVVADEDFQI